ncbi:MAG: chromosome segregation protein SMC [Micrococcales bacterium]|nr:chromosome segregation protein SMC [Micrococcales bacterium]
MVALTYAGRELLRTAVIALDDAYQAATPAERYVAAHIAALRAGAALLATRARPSRSSRIRSVWQMVPTIAPELGEWCAYFDMIGRRRVFVEIGREPVTQRQADDLVRDAETFLEQIAGILGVGLPIPSWRTAG